MESATAGTLRLFYATDIHGSETCFMKFVNAGKFYKADVLIMGGDVTGKMLIPVVDQGDGSYSVSFLGKDHRPRGEEVLGLEKQIRQTGYYAYRTTRDEVQAMNTDPEMVSRIFNQVMYEDLCKWLEIAEERLKATGIRMYLTPGNDDGLEVDKAFTSDTFVVNPEGRVVDLDENHEMISTGYANITPWQCPRDVAEEELDARITRMAEQVRRMETCIFNLHCPPRDCEIDNAPKLDENLRPVLGAGGGPVMVPVGSTAVKEAIAKYQPLLGLHGHIHESKGWMMLGRTRILNPGSEYAEGFLRGALVSLKNGRISSCQLTSG